MTEGKKQIIDLISDVANARGEMLKALGYDFIKGELMDEINYFYEIYKAENNICGESPWILVQWLNEARQDLKDFS